MATTLERSAGPRAEAVPSFEASGSPPAVPACWGWVAIAALIALELTTLVTYARREILWAYPGSYDQSAYLTQTYTLSRETASFGLVKALKLQFLRPQATGVLLPLQAGLHGVVLGPGRLSALSVNLAYLALFQCAFAGTLHWLTRNWWVALSGFGLTLGLKTVFQQAGGAFDFRIDFVSFCLFGTFLCALIRSRLFLTPRGSAAVGAVAAVLVLFRFITATYLVGIFGLLGAALLARRLAASDRASRARAAGRLRGWALAGAVVALVAAPVLYRQLDSIRSYYVVGHVTSTEKDIRADELGVHGGSVAALYYPRSVAGDHTGEAFWWLAAGAVAVGGFGLAAGSAARRPDGGRADAVRFVVPVALAGVGVPLAILTAHAVKSPVVGVVLLPGLLWAVVAPLAAAARALSGWPWVLPGVAVATLAGGFLTAFGFASAPGPYSRFGEDVPRAMGAMDDLIDACERKGMAAPVFFTDAVSPDFQPSVIQLTEYERHGRWRDYRDSGTSIFAGEPEGHVRRLTAADLVVLGGPAVGGYKFPYDEALERLRPRLRAYCEGHLAKVGEYRTGGRVVTVYVRGYLRVGGVTSDGWVTDQGVTLSGTLADLKRCRRIDLARTSTPNFLGRNPGATAELTLPGRPPRTLPATVNGDLGSVFVDWRPVDLPPDTPLTLRIRFDAFFVPGEKGIGPDPRRLVMHVGTRPRATIIQDDD